MISIAEELDCFRPEIPLERAQTPPSSWYLRPEIFELEKSRVLSRNWTVAGRLEQLEDAGSYVATETGDESVAVVRGVDARLRAFHNVCRHHAAQVVRGAGAASELVCPYHGWTYGLDGQLLRAPRLGPVQCFDRGVMGLASMEVETWLRWVFVRPIRGESRLAVELERLAGALEATGVGSLRFLTSRSYELACNWKVFVDNYLDGGYHVARLHGDLAGGLDLGTYENECHEYFSIQRCRTARGESEKKSGSSERLGAEALYAWIYPNLMLNRYGPWLDTNRVVPLGVDRTRVDYDYFVDESSDLREEDLARALVDSDRVQREDTAICESVQRGLRSSAYNRGRYSVTHEEPMHRFHQLLHRDLTRAAAQRSAN